jgi:hypothetical protein
MKFFITQQRRSETVEKVMQFNRERFIEDILNVDFQGNVRKCAIAIGVDPGYLEQVVYTPTKKGGTKLLGGIYQYCKSTKRNPEMYIFDNE